VGIKALYLQNKIIIEQNQEIIKYLKEKLEWVKQADSKHQGWILKE
jgi:hypothetical protein